MKYAAILFSLALLAGCSQNQPADTKAEGTAEAMPKADAMAFPSHAGEPADMEFEMVKDGKTYVFGYMSTMKMVKEGTVPSYMKEKANFNGSGDTVVFEDDGKGLEARLEKEYTKQHPVAK